MWSVYRAGPIILYPCENPHCVRWDSGLCVCCGERGRVVCKVHHICITSEDFRLVKYIYCGANGNRLLITISKELEMYIHDSLLTK